MRCFVSFIFSPNQIVEKQFELDTFNDDSAHRAQEWIYAKWHELECEPLRPSGKILILDRLIGITDALGYHELSSNPESSLELAKQFATALESQKVEINIPELTVSSK